MIDHELKIGTWFDVNLAEQMSDQVEVGLCKYCGWGSWVEPSCITSGAAMNCALNRDNVRKFALRYRHEPVPEIVRSVRYQGKDGKGDSFEFLERVE